MYCRKDVMYFIFDFPVMVVLACILPLFALTFCEFWCVTFAFRESTATVCNGVHPWNFLPSISAATGNLTPQRYVWRICIALHASPRFAFALGYYKRHAALFAHKEKTRLFLQVSQMACFLHMLEISALIGLSFIASTENYGVHKLCFETFMLSSILHMICLCIVHKYGLERVNYAMTQMERFSLKLKQVCLVMVFVSFLLSLYFFYRHNTYCQNGVYSLFALCEIIFVVCNIVFHGTAAVDFGSSTFVLQEAPF